MKNFNMDETNENMVEIGGIVFVIDLERYSEVLSPTEEETTSKEVESKTAYDGDGNATAATITTREYDKGKEVDAPKYDVLRMCLEIMLTYNDEVDDSLGLERALKGTTISFKMAFNTLLKYGILKEVETDEE